MNANIEHLVQEHRVCMEQVVANEYHVNAFELVVSRHPGILECTDPAEIVSFWNEFWWELPDSPVIHRAPFSRICDICEIEP